MNDVIVNTRIRARRVRVIDDAGQQLGVVSFQEALTHAQSRGLDLIQINAGEVPVCRIGDAGKFIFERKKNLRENARRQRELQVEIKEIQLRPVTDPNDIQVKARKANEFLATGDKVKIVVRFKGRERANKAQGRRVIDEFLAQIVEFKLDRPVNDTGRDLNVVISPLKSKADLMRQKQS